MPRKELPEEIYVSLDTHEGAQAFSMDEWAERQDNPPSPSLLERDPLWLNINTRNFCFTGRLADLMRVMIKTRPTSVRAEDIMEQIWGRAAPSRGALDQLIFQARQRVPALIELTSTSRYRLHSAYAVRAVEPPSPIKSKEAVPRSPPTPSAAELIINIDGEAVEFNAREAKLMRLMLQGDRLTFHSVRDLLAFMRLRPDNRRPIDKVITTVRLKAGKDVFQSGGYTKGWRLNPSKRFRLIRDNGPKK